MAQQGNRLHQENYCCSICLNLLKDPVTIPCGHNYCMSCIETHWDGEDQKKFYTCPQCRENFKLRPVLVKNTMLEELVENLKTGVQAAPAGHCYAGPGDVACDVCTGMKLKALKSCLVCLVSYCEQHLQAHYKSAAFENHKLVNPSRKLKQNICSDHNEVKKIFCRTDHECICYLCSMNKHRGHETVPAEVERTERQKGFRASLQNIQQRIQTREDEVKMLQQEMDTIRRSADNAVSDSDKIVTELIHHIKERGSEVKQQIRSQQLTETSRVKELKKKLEQEIEELKRKDAELKQLSHTEDHTEFLLCYPGQSQLDDFPVSSSIEIRPVRYFEDVAAALSEAGNKVQNIFREQWRRVSLRVRSVDVLLPKEEPKTRDEFLKYSCQITLDPNTANEQLILCDRDRRVAETYSSTYYNSDRYTVKKQVLSKESLSGSCYWEVEWDGKGISVAVAYKDRLNRDGNGFGNNDKSWALDCFKNCYKFRHNSVTTNISGPQSSRVGVYVDTRAGILSFYSVSNTMTLLHRVQTTFTQPLYAGLWIWPSYWNNTTGEFIELE